MLTRSDFLSLNFVKKEDYPGSYKGLRYMLHKAEVDEETNLQIYIWPEPFCSDATPDEQKKSKMFEFSEDGLAEGIEWMNSEYETVKKQPT